MGADRFTYIDVSDDARAARYVQVGPSITGEIPLDFVGRSMTQLADSSYVAEIRRTPERDAFVSFTSVMFQNVECSTLLEDGTVVTTSMTPPLRNLVGTFGVLFEHNPALRIHHGMCRTRSVAELVRRHRERVARFSAERGSALVPCETLREYFAIRWRCSDVKAKQLAIGTSTSVIWAVLVALALFGATAVHAYCARHPSPLDMIAYVLLVCSGFPLIWLYTTAILPVVYRFAIRSPLPGDVSALLDRASATPSGLVPANASW